MSQHSNPDQRRRQRLCALKDGKPCIELRVNDKRFEVNDLSLDGFSLPAGSETPDQEFDFVMRLIDGFGDRISGRAIPVAPLAQADKPRGFRFTELSAQHAQTLQEWLIVIVICGASVRLSTHEAEAIVKGPSLI